MTMRRMVAALVLVTMGLVPLVGGAVLADDRIPAELQPTVKATPWFCLTPPLSWVCVG